MPYQLRLATPGDADAIRAIYNVEVSSSTVTFDLVERSAEEQREWMAAHDGVYPVVVADDGGEVIGFACLSAYRPRPAYSTSAEDSVYVAATRRGEGIGRALLAAVLERGRQHGFHAVVA